MSMIGRNSRARADSDADWAAGPDAVSNTRSARAEAVMM
jgi:hypothetical protein